MIPPSGSGFLVLAEINTLRVADHTPGTGIWHFGGSGVRRPSEPAGDSRTASFRYRRFLTNCQRIRTGCSLGAHEKLPTCAVEDRSPHNSRRPFRGNAKPGLPTLGYRALAQFSLQRRTSNPATVAAWFIAAKSGTRKTRPNGRSHLEKHA